MNRFAAFAAVGFVVAAGSATAHEKMDIGAKVSDPAAAAAIAERHATMNALGANMKKVGGFLTNGERQAIAASAREIASLAKSMAAQFPAGTGMDKYPEVTGARPEIWRMRKEFESAALELATLAERLAASSGNDMRAAFGALGRSCSGCHRTFRRKLN